MPSPKKRDLGKEIIEGLQWALADMRGENPPGGRRYVVWVPDVKAIRKKHALSQTEFAARFGLSKRTVEQWEQGRAVPDQPARVLLSVIEQAPGTVARAVKKTQTRRAA
ncbi:MAG: helix-turn-helix domain-containing protein [Rhodospirillaceae bacterium]|nr:helix-turn-helix domain-containing protein [Rhodospirillaceae bacterium]